MLIDRFFTSVYAPASGVRPTNDEPPPEDDTIRTMPHAVIEDVLGASLGVLARLTTTPRTRELRGMADAYRRAIARWELVPPNDAQRKTMRELVFALHAQVAQAADNARKR